MQTQNTIENKAARKRFSAMWTDKLGEAVKAASVEPYPIECHYGTDDFESFERAVGIDSHLEAIHFAQADGDCGRSNFVLSPDSVPVLVRRLLESGEDNDMSLASSICETLDIELI